MPSVGGDEAKLKSSRTQGTSSLSRIQEDDAHRDREDFQTVSNAYT